MDIRVTAPSEVNGDITIPFSKSITNRVLLLNKLCDSKMPFYKAAVCDDTEIMKTALSSKEEVIDTGSAGTATRFMTAYLALKEGKHVITGSQRMKQRPIGILVDALRDIGADIKYLEQEGFLPLEIVGRPLKGGNLSLSGGVSSQFISALLMIAPYTESGITITLEGETISRPYIDMTLALMRDYGVNACLKGNKISVAAGKYMPMPFTVEADWSAASYWYGFAALSKDADIILSGLNAVSFQGDSAVAELFSPLGVATEYNDGYIRLHKCNSVKKRYDADLTANPDLVQTIVVTAALKGCPFRLSGLNSLRIKETDRIAALVCEMRKLGFILNDSPEGVLSWDGERTTENFSSSISTYDDHRMAMAFSIASFTFPRIEICNAEVVSKSYPDFWNALSNSGFLLEKV